MSKDSERNLMAGSELRPLLDELHEDWETDEANRRLTRRVMLKDFDAALALVNRLAVVASEQNHHPDIHFGWGYCEVSYSSHDVGGLTLRDITSARALDAIVASL